MSGDIMTVIKDWLWIPIPGPIALLLALLSAYFGSGWARRGIGWTFALGRTRKLKALQARRDLLQQLHDSDRQYYGYLLSGILGVLLVFAAQLGAEGLLVPQLAITAVDKQMMGLSLSTARHD